MTLRSVAPKRFIFHSSTFLGTNPNLENLLCIPSHYQGQGPSSLSQAPPVIPLPHLYLPYLMFRWLARAQFLFVIIMQTGGYACYNFIVCVPALHTTTVGTTHRQKTQQLIHSINQYLNPSPLATWSTATSPPSPPPLFFFTFILVYISPINIFFIDLPFQSLSYIIVP